MVYEFTFHHVSIKTMELVTTTYFPHDSHSTMYLLKRCATRRSILCTRFTFHHVSIKTDFGMYENVKNIDSHSTMYLLKLGSSAEEYEADINSHSTMYLLKPQQYPLRCLIARRFTFHHVSIKTKEDDTLASVRRYSHSTMYLLKRNSLRML